MLNVSDLEQKHKRYKVQQRTPYYKLYIGFAIIVAITLFFVIDDIDSGSDVTNEVNIQKEKNLPLHPNKTAQKIESEPVPATIKKTLHESNTTTQKMESTPTIIKEDIKIEQKEKKIILSPSLNFLDSLKPEKLSKEKNIKSIINQDKTIKKTKKENLTSSAIVDKPIKSLSLKQDSINIKRKDDEYDIVYVIERFNTTQNPILSLFIAKKYYHLGDYTQSYNYALKTNEIDNSIEESWIIFSKSLVKLNKKEMAVQTLKKYISHSDSSQAKELLNDILSEKFK